MEGQALRSAESFINSVASDLKHMGYSTQAKSTLGVPVEAILQEAKAIGADLLMMGSRGRHGLSRMVLGSVAHAVLHHAQCPLLVFH
jgi:nucleotide-binding universal stress UspA family protein